ncbi:MAG: ABC transporter ATP-binding protein [Angustibacter sp.]
MDVHALHKSYGSTIAVNDISFSVQRGEFFGILGPNGAGKTTTLEIIEGLREADSGTVRILGESPWPRNLGLLPRIGVQLQGTAFFDKLSTREQLRIFAALYGVGGTRVDEMLELVGLREKAKTRADLLSGGQRQRLSIACALVHEPELVFFDEPTAALDPQARRNLWDVLREVQAAGTTVVYTTHYLDEAEVLCDRVAIMDQGRILALDTPAALIRQFAADTRISLPAGTIPRDLIAALPEVSSVQYGPAELTLSSAKPGILLQALAERDLLAGVSVRTATLEDVFLARTGREYRA